MLVGRGEVVVVEVEVEMEKEEEEGEEEEEKQERCDYQIIVNIQLVQLTHCFYSHESSLKFSNII